ncbi:hypothetical protein BDA99DRAFT_504411 [Phascolomyces articulosus]|uniref:Uncharacterized protein n=1 Tax=Phascolomyces articulosus TaxID=60185 RepID=A0AAD5PHA2_9FUNG|nr:hypothetical protein BDA99DRAFT_504411 [Phascolomyces articulosus]
MEDGNDNTNVDKPLNQSDPESANQRYSTIRSESHHSISETTATPKLTGPIRKPHRNPAPRYDPIFSSSSSRNLSISDRTFIDFTRCLYQTKSIVKGLQQFSNSICPALRLSPFNGHSASSSLRDPRLSSEEFVCHVNQYLDNTFQKISRLCKILLLILERIEQGHTEVRRERIDSFRTEVWEQIRQATYTKETLIRYIQQHIDSVVNTTSGSTSSSTPSPSSKPSSPTNGGTVPGELTTASPTTSAYSPSTV